MDELFITVVELPEFLTQAKKCMDESSREAFINFIANHPEEGDLIQGTGGARKIRWQAKEHSGKRGGVRIVYYYHDEGMPVFLFTVYAKNQQANLSMKERNELKVIIKEIVKIYHSEGGKQP